MTSTFKITFKNRGPATIQISPCRSNSMLLVEVLLGGEVMELVGVRVRGVVSGYGGCNCLFGEILRWRMDSLGEDTCM